MAAPVTYTELADVLDAVPLLLQQERQTRRLGLREAADEIGVSLATVYRVESGSGYHADTAAAILRWLGSPPGQAAT
jgi:transcriptional regulator with XRE-family HTH domain